MTEPIPAEIESLALAAIGNAFATRDTVIRAVFGQHYSEGDRKTFRSPITGAKLGIVYVTDPDPKMVITDRAALHAYLETSPENLITDVSVAEADMPEALAVLAEHAPHLITETTRLNPTSVDAALAKSRKAGKPTAPGIEVVKAAGVLTVKPDPGAYEQVAQLIQARVLTWDARPVLPEAEAS